MAEDDASHVPSPPVPTAIDIQVEEFPSPGKDHVSTPTIPPTTLKTSTAHGASSSDLPADMTASNDTPNDTPKGRADRIPAPPTSTADFDSPAISRPSAHKFATERPQPAARRSILRAERAGSIGERLPQLEQRGVRFDPYSSDSSSDDEDERHRPSGAEGASQPGPSSKLSINHEHFNTKGKVSKRDGRLRLTINETLNSGYFAKTLGAGIKKHFQGVEDDASNNHATEKIEPEEDCMEDLEKRVRLNIVVIVIGSRGDIQPFLRIGKILKEDYGHRVRIATHPAFKQFVEKDSGLEFFSIGGNPSELMAFMVKNPGLIPNLETVKEGEIGRRRAAMYEMFQGMWRACINSTDEESDRANLKMSEYSFYSSWLGYC
jgi:hypothetical protein